MRGPDPRAILGRSGERRARWFFRLRGYRVLEANARIGRGEIDLIVRRGRRVAFVEVKTRRGGGMRSPAEAVDRKKQLQIARLAERWCRGRSLSGCHLHFDVLAILGEGWG